eukprot:scaffold36074_cov144-Skeletonema_dohrnii-CCMP3373.AAC.1
MRGGPCALRLLPHGRRCHRIFILPFSRDIVILIVITHLLAAEEGQFHGESHVLLFLRGVGFFSGIPVIALFKAGSAHLMIVLLNSILKSSPVRRTRADGFYLNTKAAGGTSKGVPWCQLGRNCIWPYQVNNSDPPVSCSSSHASFAGRTTGQKFQGSEKQLASSTGTQSCLVQYF